MQRLRDKLAISERTAKAEAQLKVSNQFFDLPMISHFIGFLLYPKRLSLI